MKLLALALLSMLPSAPAALPVSSRSVPAPAEVELWRLPCGVLNGEDFAGYSDTHRYDGQKRDLVVSCYLIRHGDDYMLWDAGLAEKDLVDEAPMVAQLAQIGIGPERIRYLGISHRHADHTGQAFRFPGATLLIGGAGFESLRASNYPGDRAGLLPWLDGGAKVEAIRGDRDVFGDGSVVMLNMPGHTESHHALLVKLDKMGWVLISGDLFHQRDGFEHDQVPAFNFSRADTLASISRFKGIAANLEATVIIGHEVLDISKLPYFPESAR